MIDWAIIILGIIHQNMKRELELTANTHTLIQSEGAGVCPGSLVVRHRGWWTHTSTLTSSHTQTSK